MRSNPNPNLVLNSNHHLDAVPSSSLPTPNPSHACSPTNPPANEIVLPINPKSVHARSQSSILTSTTPLTPSHPPVHEPAPALNLFDLGDGPLHPLLCS